LGVHSGFTYEQSELMRKKEQRRGGTTLLRVFLNQRAFLLYRLGRSNFFLKKQVFYANQTIYDFRGRQRRGFAGDECFSAVT